MKVPFKKSLVSKLLLLTAFTFAYALSQHESLLIPLDSGNIDSGNAYAEDSGNIFDYEELVGPTGGSNDDCPADPFKDDPGICGCGIADVDANGTGIIDCLSSVELKSILERMLTNIKKVKLLPEDASKAKRQAMKARIAGIKADLTAAGFIVDNPIITIILANPALNLADERKALDKAVKRGLKVKSETFKSKKNKAKKSLSALIAQLNSAN